MGGGAVLMPAQRGRGLQFFLMENPNRIPRRVAVLGAGIVGLATAWRLHRDGHEVTVIDRAQPGSGASAANGAQLSYAYVQPLADPSIWAQLPTLLLAKDSPLSLRIKLDPAQWAWGLQFLAACRASVSRETTAQLLALAAESRIAFDALRADLLAAGLSDGQFSATGKLVMYSTAESFAAARQQLALQQALGTEQHALSPADCLAVEPALADSLSQYAGGIHTPGECAADAGQVCRSLHQWLATRGVRFVLDTAIDGLVVRQGQVAAVQTAKGFIDTDAVVLALGTGSVALARTLGVRLPIYPLKGYSITLPGQSTGAPTVNVTDAKRKLVFARLGDRLRVAGMAELVGENRDIPPGRIDRLIQQTREVFPQAHIGTEVQPWAGLRPATPTARPIVGTLPQAPTNLLFNVGHGALGFTLAAGSATRLSALLHGRGASDVSPVAAAPAACSA